MKNIVIFIIVFSITIFCCSKTFADEFNCYVVKVEDGDTFTCADGTIVKIWGIDTPEIPPRVKIAQSGGYEARDYLRLHIYNELLKCDYKEISYSRKISQCFIEGRDIAIILLEKELAKEIKKESNGYYSKYTIMNNE